MKGDYTKAKQITTRTKEKVFKRQNGKSILSGETITLEQCCCHFIGRGLGGVGYEWNIVGLTADEHRLLDENKPIIVRGKVRYTNQEAQTLIRNHLILNYSGWSVDKCKYKKWFEEQDYGVTYNANKLKNLK